VDYFTQYSQSISQWPGYEHVEWARSIEVATQGPMTRAQLGAAVAINFARFVDVSRTYLLTTVTYINFLFAFRKLAPNLLDLLNGTSVLREFASSTSFSCQCATFSRMSGRPMLQSTFAEHTSYCCFTHNLN
jgi:hypothetical protein